MKWQSGCALAAQLGALACLAASLRCNKPNQNTSLGAAVLPPLCGSAHPCHADDPCIFLLAAFTVHVVGTSISAAAASIASPRGQAACMWAELTDKPRDVFVEQLLCWQVQVDRLPSPLQRSKHNRRCVDGWAAGTMAARVSLGGIGVRGGSTDRDSTSTLTRRSAVARAARWETTITVQVPPAGRRREPRPATPHTVR